MGAAFDGSSEADDLDEDVGQADQRARIGLDEVVRGPLRWMRRRLALIVSLVALMWIITVVVLITLHPVAGGGNPMD